MFRHSHFHNQYSGSSKKRGLLGHGPEVFAEVKIKEAEDFARKCWRNSDFSDVKLAVAD
jgi:hypothetical protein